MSERDSICASEEKPAWSLVPCREWTKGKFHNGYGTARHQGRNMGVHRLEWIKHNGPITTEQHVCHHCDNPACYEIRHLFLGTAKDNSLDALQKGRLRNGWTSCVHGHPYVAGSFTVRLRGNGRRERVCLECKRATHRASRRRKRERIKKKRAANHFVANRRRKLTGDLVVLARQRFASGESKGQIARSLGVSATAISYAVRRITWKDIA